MNPLGNGNINNGLPQGMAQNIQQVKAMMQMANGNPNVLIQQMGQNNPMLNQVMQMCKGQNPQDVFMSMCKQRGVDPQAVLNELQK